MSETLEAAPEVVQTTVEAVATVTESVAKETLKGGSQRTNGPVVLLLFSGEFATWRKRRCATLSDVCEG